MSYSGRGLQGWPLAVALLAAVYAAGVGAVLFRPDGSTIAIWWPAAGIAVALVALRRGGGGGCSAAPSPS